MKILLVHNNIDIQGGNDLFVNEIRRILETNGNSTYLFHSQNDAENENLNKELPTFSSTSSNNIIAKATSVPRYIYNKEAKEKLKKVIYSFKPDIIHYFTIYGRLTVSVLEASKEMGIPSVMSCNDYKHICGNRMLFHHGKFCDDCKSRNFLKIISNKCVHDSFSLSTIGAIESGYHSYSDVWRKNVSRFLFSSEYMKRITTEFWPSNTFKFDTLRNPFDYISNKGDIKVGDYFLYFGRVSEEKGVDKIIHAAKDLKNIKFKIVGDGPELKKLQDISKNNDNVSFMGSMWGDKLKNLIVYSRAVIVPSIWPENYPYVMLQAFAAGTPVIGSNKGGIPELLNNEKHGWLFNPDGSKSLINILKKVNEVDQNIISKKGEAAQNFVRDNFDDATIYSDLKNIYKKAIQ